jgi:hypothetical protein
MHLIAYIIKWGGRGDRGLSVPSVSDNLHQPVEVPTSSRKARTQGT